MRVAARTTLFALLFIACDKKEPEAKAAPAEALVCGLFQTAVNESMIALTACVSKASAARADAEKSGTAPSDPSEVDTQPCDAPRKSVTEANEKYLACIDGQPGALGGVIDAAIRKMVSFSDDMCTCKDKACAERVTAEMVKYSELMSHKLSGSPELEPNGQQKKDLETAMRRLTECTTTAMGG